MTKKLFGSYIINFISVVLVFAIIMFLTSTGVIDRYVTGILTLICINIILAVSLNVTTGCLGQIALGHAGFMSVGAYTAALITKSGMVTGFGGYLIAILIGGAFAAVIGIIIGIPALRLRGDYLAIITLAFGEIIRVVIENLSITGGAQGLRGIDKKLSSLPTVFWIMVISVTIMYTFMKSRHGRAILAIREDDIASDASGINNTFYRTLAFTVSAFFAGVAGAMFAHYIGILGASKFGFDRSIEILVIVVLGGLGSFTGSVFTAILLTALPEVLRQFADYRMLVYALALIIMMIFKPSGIFGTKEISVTKGISKILDFFRGTKKAKTSEKEGKAE